MGKVSWALMAVLGYSGAAAPQSGVEVLLNRAQQAHGVIDHAVVVRLEGELDLGARFQGANGVDTSWMPIVESIAVEPAGNVRTTLDWYNYLHSRQRLGEYYRPGGDVGGPLLLFSDFAAESHSWMPFWVVADQSSRYRRRLPALLVAEMRSAGSLLLSAPSELTWTTAAGDVLVVQFDPDSGRVTGLSTPLDMPLAGDSSMRWEWKYRQAADAHPSMVRVWLNERLLRRQRISVEVVSEPVAAPAGAPPPPAARVKPEQPLPSQQAPVVKPLAPGIHQIVGLRPGFHLIFVEFSDHVVAIDAPSGWLEMQQLPPLNWSGDRSTALGDKYLQAIRATTDKPVRYVVATHHHSDHIGGIRAFVDAGATVVGTAETLAVIAAALQRPTLISDGKAARVDFTRKVVQGRERLGAGDMAIDLLELPENPHAQGYMLVSIPGHDLVYSTAFIYPVESEQQVVAEAEDASRWLIRWMSEHGLRPSLHYNVHGVEPLAEWQRALYEQD